MDTKKKKKKISPYMVFSTRHHPAGHRVRVPAVLDPDGLL